MGTFYTKCKIENSVDRAKSMIIPKLLVDTGSEYTWIAGARLDKLGIKKEKKEGLNLAVDPTRKKLVAAGPIPAASAKHLI